MYGAFSAARLPRVCIGGAYTPATACAAGALGLALDAALNASN